MMLKISIKTTVDLALTKLRREDGRPSTGAHARTSRVGVCTCEAERTLQLSGTRNFDPMFLNISGGSFFLFLIPYVLNLKHS